MAMAHWQFRLRGTGPFFPAVAVLVFLVAWMAAAYADPHGSAGLERFQTVFAGLAAICTALFAYGAATWSSREQRRARKLSVFLMLRQSCVLAILGCRGARAQLIRTRPEGETPNTTAFATLLSLPPGLNKAAENMDLLPAGAVNPVTALLTASSKLKDGLSEHTTLDQVAVTKSWVMLDQIESFANTVVDAVDPEIEILSPGILVFAPRPELVGVDPQADQPTPSASKSGEAEQS